LSSGGNLFMFIVLSCSGKAREHKCTHANAL
jgi:hypothetical protein